MTLRKFNNLLSIVVIIFGFYIAVGPFLPQVAFWLRDKSPESSAPYQGALAEVIGSDSNNEIPKDNRIVIPSIQVDEPIVEGSGIWVISSGGTWRRPQTSKPTDNGNTVIVGHRFYGSNTSTFYHLDKVKIGEKLALYWEGEELLYEVSETKVVEPEELGIESQEGEKRLTLYTCTPIWTAKQRLVIVAKPIEKKIEEGVAKL